MKNRFIANGVLALLLFVFMVVLLVSTRSLSIHRLGTLTPFFISAISIYSVLGVAALVMGIVTLSLPKPNEVKGLAVASGTIGIVSLFFGISAIAGVVIAIIGLTKLSGTKNLPGPILPENKA